LVSGECLEAWRFRPKVESLATAASIVVGVAGAVRLAADGAGLGVLADILDFNRSGMGRRAVGTELTDEGMMNTYRLPGGTGSRVKNRGLEKRVSCRLPVAGWEDLGWKERVAVLPLGP
jgi:hypothetical protein